MIEFKQIKFKNFMLYGNQTTTVDFTNGLHLISGMNGTGKSTIFMAMFYALYGKTYKKNKIGSLVNTTNNKDMLVELVFNIGNTTYTIIRGQKPNKFEIYQNQVLIDQNSSVTEYQQWFQTNVLKITESTFKQLIFLGANVSSKSFFDLSKSEKEELFEIITDTQIFKVLKDKSKEKVKYYNSIKQELEYKIGVLNQQKNQYIQLIENISESDEIAKQQRLSEIITVISKYNKQLNVLKQKKPEFTSLSQELQNKQLELNNLTNNLYKIQAKIEQESNAKQKYLNCIGCDNLKYLISFENVEEFKQTFDIITEQIKSLNDYILSLQTRYNKFQEAFNKGREISITVKELESEKIELSKPVENVAKTLLQQSLDTTLAELAELKTSLTDIDCVQVNYKTLEKLFDSSTVKGIIIKQSLPLLNSLINEILNEFSNFGFNLFIDEELKENIKFKRDDFEIASLSSGQSMRTMFAIMFAFLRLIEKRNGVSTNILILDEVLDSALDYNGRIELLSMLTKFFKDKSCYIISHNNEILHTEEYFNSNIIVSQKNRFSYLEVKH